MQFIRKHFRLLSILSLLLVAIVTTFSVYELRKTRFDYDFESFFPTGDPDLEVYLRFRKTFGYDNEFVLLAIENKSGIFQKDFLENVQQLTDSLRSLPDITGVSSPTDMTYMTPTGAYPYMHIDDPSRFASDSATIYRSKELVGSYFSNDAKAVSLYIHNTEGISKVKSDTLLARMNRQIARYHFDGVHMASKLNGQKVYLDRLQHEFYIFFSASFFLVVLFLFFSFRSAWGIWVPILVVLLAIIWTLGLMMFMGKPLDIMTVLLPTMMFVVGMSDAVHIASKFLEELRNGVRSKFDAVIASLREVGTATFITSLTTAVGFLTLANSHIRPIRDFGLYTAAGVFIAFLLAHTIMPIVLNAIPRPKEKTIYRASASWNKFLRRLLLWILRNRKTIGAGTVILLLAGIWGTTRIRVNNYMIEGLTTKDQLREDFNFFENHFSGVRPFELILTPSDTSSSLLGVKELRATDKLEKYLEKNYGVGFLLSPLTIVKGINKAQNNGNPDYFVLPEDSSAVADLAGQAAHYRKAKELRSLLTKDAKEGRITGKMHDVGSYVIRGKNASLKTFLANDPAMKALHVRLTGAAMMLDKNNEYLVANTMQGLLISILVISLVMALIHRSLRMVIVSIIPNIIPILCVSGLMGFAGIDMKSSTSIVFSIAFGIAVDDTIHFLGRFKLERMKGKPVVYAVKRTFLSTGKAVIITSVILCAGFLTLIGSGFESTFYFGLLVSVTLFVAVIADLLLFPVLVTWLIRDNN